VLYLAIPAQNEAATIGVLLWRLRTVLAEFPREYEAVVYDDASSDSTSEILEGYARVMPLTILRGEKPVGYAGAVNALVRHIARQTRYPRRDAMLLLQGDFTDPPAMVPEFVKRFEGGADLVVGERTHNGLKDAPLPVRRMQRATGWMLRLLVKAEGVRDVTSSYRLIRISVLRDLLRTVGDAPVCAGDSQSANADFLLHLIPLARRVETLEVEPTWGVRLRETRLVAMRDGMSLARWAWRARGRKAVASTAPETGSDTPRAPRPTRDRERDASNVLPFEPVEAPRPPHPRPSTNGAPNGTQSRKARPARTVVASDDEDVTSLASARTKPPRRKRSRGGKKDSASLESNGASEDEASLSPAPFEAASDLAYQEPLDTRDVAGAFLQPPDTFVEHPPLSPALSEAAEAAEDSFDEEITSARPPRKRRRRRGSRKGGAHSGPPTEGEQTESEELDTDTEADSEATESPYADDATEPVRPRSRGRGRSRHEGRTPAPDAEGGESAEREGSGAEDGDAARGDDSADTNDDGEGEPRARRRGRRGRRGGSRRNRANRGEGAGDGAGGGSESPGEHFESGPPTSAADGA
jgi:hypothetical protein